MLEFEIASYVDGKRLSSEYELDFTGARVFKDIEKIYKNAIITIANDTYNNEMKGHEPNPRVRVDGSFSKSIDNVKPFGKVEIFARVTDIIQPIRDAYDIILGRSPVDTGLYRSLNWVYFNNKRVATTRGELLKFLEKQAAVGFKNNDLFSFVNIAPYARKLERLGVRRETRGRNAGSHQSKSRRGKKSGFRIPNGTYVVAQRAIKTKLLPFAVTFKTKFLPLNVQVGSMRNRFVKDGRLYVYPTIDVRIKEKGMLQ